MKSLLSFIAGAAIGGTATYFITKRLITEKANIEANKKINESIKELTSIMTTPTTPSEEETVESQDETIEECVEEEKVEDTMTEEEQSEYYRELGYDSGYDPDEIIDRINGRLNKDGEDKLDDIEDIQSAYFITPAQFDEKNGYEKIFVDYYVEDGAYVNAEDGTLFLMSGYAKEELLDEFEQLGIVSCQCLRNDYLKCDVEIDKVYGDEPTNEDEIDGCVVN